MTRTFSVGHINLATTMNGIGEHFIRLIEALDAQKVPQHVLVANAALARRIAVCEHVSVGPVVRAPVMAYCLMPEVAVVHAHEAAAAQAGLLLTLTRSIPYVVTRRARSRVGRNPIARAALSRAASVICPTASAARALQRDGQTTLVDLVEDIRVENGHSDAAIARIAALHLRVYRRAVDSPGLPAMLL